MNKILTICSLLLLMLCQAQAQTQAISEQDFQDISESAYQKTSAESYRKTLKSQHFHHISDEKPHFQRNVVTERVAKDYYEILEDINGEEVTRTETIEINNRKYLRENNGEWKDGTNIESGGFYRGKGTIVEPEETNAEQKYLGKETIKGQPVDVYQQKITRKYKDRGLSINEEIIWIDQKGRFVKTEQKSRLGDKHIFQMTVVYEYDPNIKINAPQIK